MINFSIIIPHKNIPELLERCLESIPVRDDVQVIVVDDNSDERLVNFARFPGHGRPNTEVIFHKSSFGDNPSSGGAGMARNLALDVARGKWLVFADADDFFHPSIALLMDKYADADADMILFRHDSVDSSSLEPVAINTRRNRILDDMIRTGDNSAARYTISVPWARFIRRELVRAHDIRFDQVRFSNTTLFSLKVGYFAERVVADPTVAYCNVRREGSLIREGRKDWEAMSQRFDVDYRAALFARSVGLGGVLDNGVAERWKELSLLHRRGARRLLPRLREVCAPSVVRRVRFEEAVRRIKGFFVPKKGI
jgi:glycosyltransferase involved in cell wall biosynthesis